MDEDQIFYHLCKCILFTDDAIPLFYKITNNLRLCWPQIIEGKAKSRFIKELGIEANWKERRRMANRSIRKENSSIDVLKICCEEYIRWYETLTNKTIVSKHNDLFGKMTTRTIRKLFVDEP